ncbi:MAG: hypothetical protein WBG92_19305 [Thiohalocapsa sp.]
MPVTRSFGTHAPSPLRRYARADAYRGLPALAFALHGRQRETCFSLDPLGKGALLQWIERGALQLRTIETGDLAAIADVLMRFAEHNIDLADATLVWLAEAEGTQRVLTTDRRDVDMLRTADGRSFERLLVSP